MKDYLKLLMMQCQKFLKKNDKMIKCPNCGSSQNTSEKFCGKWGTKLPEPKICPNCNYQSYENEYCTQCGSKLIPKTIKTKKVHYSAEIKTKIRNLKRMAFGLKVKNKYENAFDYANRALEKNCSNEKLMELIDNINKEINGCV